MWQITVETARLTTRTIPQTFNTNLRGKTMKYEITGEQAETIVKIVDEVMLTKHGRHIIKIMESLVPIPEEETKDD